MGNSFSNMKNNNEPNYQPGLSQKSKDLEGDPKEMGSNNHEHGLQIGKGSELIGSIFLVLKWWNDHKGNKVALTIASIALIYHFSKGKKLSRLEEALQIFEMKDLSEYSKMSFNWIYLCKKKQFTASKGLGNALAAAFYEEKLRSLEEARQIIEKQVSKKDQLHEDQPIKADK